MGAGVAERQRSLRGRFVALFIVCLVAVALWQAGQLRSRASQSQSGDTRTGLTVYAGERGLPLPEITGRTVGGRTLSLQDLRGHVVVLNVWGSWCGPCRAEAPDLARISKESKAREVRFVGIDVRDDPDAALAFEREYDITYPSFDDQNALVLAQFTGIIPVNAVPSTLVADRNGVIRARVVGQVDAATLRGLIEDTEKIS